MTQQTVSAGQRFAAVVEAFLSVPGVTPPEGGSKRAFGSDALKVDNNKIFAMLVKGQLVVKLPRQRVDALIAAGQGLPFDSGKGRIMKEWLVVEGGMWEESIHVVEWHLIHRELEKGSTW